jgi:hypothetical protein
MVERTLLMATIGAIKRRCALMAGFKSFAPTSQPSMQIGQRFGRDGFRRYCDSFSSPPGDDFVLCNQFSELECGYCFSMRRNLCADRSNGPNRWIYWFRQRLTMAQPSAQSPRPLAALMCPR